jgi:hypothetical protein
MSTQALEPTKLPKQDKEGCKLGSESDNLPKLSTELMNEWSYMSLPPCMEYRGGQLAQEHICLLLCLHLFESTPYHFQATLHKKVLCVQKGNFGSHGMLKI